MRLRLVRKDLAIEAGCEGNRGPSVAMKPIRLPISPLHWLALLCLSVWSGAARAELKVSSDFEGGSGVVEKLDPEARVVQLMPGGDPQRGWPCWWFVRVDGLGKDEKLTINLGGSTRPARNNGQDTGKPIAAGWAQPMRAAVSSDREHWAQSEPGRREKNRLLYQVTGTGGPLWIAWGPPFTPQDTEALIGRMEKALSAAKGFELSQTNEKRPVRGVRVNESTAAAPRGVWVQARQHAWESGGSWVARGFAEWLASDDAEARWVRANAEVVIVPIMDVDNVVTGNGGKEAAPRDHNRDWDDHPIHPEVTAAQQRLREWAGAGRLDLFLELHNPGYSDLRPFFFAGPEDLLAAVGQQNRADFLKLAVKHVSDPLAVEDKIRITGPSYHPLWRQISTQWVTDHGNPQTVAMCLETAWNTAHSNTEGYLTVGRQLGLTIAEYLREHPKP